MALPDIKEAGVLADVRLFGWPYHGLCVGGSVTLPNAATHAVTQPRHGAAWLYDMGIPAVARSPSELIDDAALGHQWLNYGFISGGVVYGTQLGDNKFIYVDPDGVRWLIGMTGTAPEISANKVRLSFAIEKFGVLRENGAGTSIYVDVQNVQCTSISLTSFGGATYTTTAIWLEDVWTNGTKALVGVYRTNGLTSDLFSVIELQLSGIGGADGSGVVIAPAEILAASDLTYQTSTYSEFDPSPMTATISYASSTSGDCETRTIASVSGINWWLPYTQVTIPNIYELAHANRETTSTFARVPHYSTAGTPHVYRLTEGYKQQYQYTGDTQTPYGSATCGTYCNACRYDLYYTWITYCTFSIEYGLSLMLDSTEIDSVKVTQNALGLEQGYHITSAGFGTLPWDGPDPIVLPPIPAGWNAFLNETTNPKSASFFYPPTMSGSLAGSLSLTMPPHTDGTGATFQAFDLNNNNPLSATGVLDIRNAWRTGSVHFSSGSANIGGTDVMGIQRIDSKSAAFYKDVSGTRTYGTIHTPLGSKSYSSTSTTNIFFTWNRKTGEFSFSTSPICYV